MSEVELLRLLDELRKLPHETEWVEFKEAIDNYDFRKLGKYFSALANEANLKNQPGQKGPPMICPLRKTKGTGRTGPFAIKHSLPSGPS